MSERWYPHVTVACIARRDSKYLMVREYCDGSSVINQPAGHLEQGESLWQAVIRETLEETGYHFEPRYISGIYQFVAANGETYLRFTFYGELVGEQTDQPLDSDINEIVWFNRQELEKHIDQLRSQAVLACVADFEAGQQLPLVTVQGLQLEV